MKYGEKMKPEMADKIKRMYLSKISVKEIAKITGLSLYRIRCVCYTSSLPRQGNRQVANDDKARKVAMKTYNSLPENVRGRILVLSNFGYTVGEIAEDLQLGTNCVSKVVRYLSESNKIKRLV